MATAARALRAVRPHVPLIKFRDRKSSPLVYQATGEPVFNAPNPPPSSAVPSTKPVGSTPRGSGIDSSELPLKYRRRLISAEEMEFIEKGGPI